ncbi:LysR family nod box-dependent transcriptional activator [Undibacterium sp. GrIS 1.2]|uniref:LysR family transcriptional regulator n=1 Tax=Undibacterium sp. GrIS 1.2 TaxID=3143933 RepID=UPI00339AA5A7
MRFNKLDLNLLVALDALLAERSITRAAQRLNLSQSATSGVLARLRDYFEDEILTQIGRNMVMTPLAASLEAPVREVLLQIQSTIETKPGFVLEESTRHFRVIASDYPTSVLMAEVARKMSELAPNVTLEIMAPGDDHEIQLDRGEIDLLIMPAKYLVEGHASEVLFQDSYSCVVWKDNTIVGDSLTLDQYMSLAHVSTKFGKAQPSFEEWFLQSTGFARRVEVSTSNFSSLPLLLVGTNRIATMHTRLADMFADYFPIRLLPLPMDIPLLVEMMQWHKFVDKDIAHIWFRTLLKEVANARRSPLAA